MLCANYFFSTARVVFCRSNLHIPILNSCHYLHTHCAQRCTSCAYGRSDAPVLLQSSTSTSLVSSSTTVTCYNHVFSISTFPTGAPRHINYETVKADLKSIPGVKHVHSVHIWSLTMSKTAIAAHLALGTKLSLFIFIFLSFSLPSAPFFPPSLSLSHFFPKFSFSHRTR